MARATSFTYKVTVVSTGSGNKYVIDGNQQQYVTLFPGGTFRFDQADSSNSGHPFRFSETDNGSHAGGSAYSTGVTVAGTPGNAGAYTEIEVTGSTPYRLYYYCTQHSGMGGLVNVPPNYTAGNRGIFLPGYSDANQDAIDYVTITTTGNATDFGDMTSYGDTEGGAGMSSFTRTVMCHDRSGSAGPGANTSTTEVINNASQGNSASFGDITANGENTSRRGGSNSVRGVTMGSFNSYGSQVPDTFATNDILFFTLTSEGNSADFGDLSYATYGHGNSMGSSTRMIHAGGSYYGGSPQTTRCRNIIDYFTIASTGNASDFGDLSVPRQILGACSTSVRSVFGGGRVAPGDQGAVSASTDNTMSYVTIASTGNDTDFGDLTVSATLGPIGMSNSTRGVFAGGRDPSPINTIGYITIASAGNAADFGDLTYGRRSMGSGGDGHGGLQ